MKVSASSITMNSSLTIRVVCLVVVLLAVVSQTEAGWWCSKTANCNWSDWTSWSPCPQSHQCGGKGVQDRKRHHIPRRTCGGYTCRPTGPSHQSRRCFNRIRRCYNGQMHNGQCVCYPNWRGPCCLYYVR